MPAIKLTISSGVARCTVKSWTVLCEKEQGNTSRVVTEGKLFYLSFIKKKNKKTLNCSTIRLTLYCCAPSWRCRGSHPRRDGRQKRDLHQTGACSFPRRRRRPGLYIGGPFLHSTFQGGPRKAEGPRPLAHAASAGPDPHATRAFPWRSPCGGRWLPRPWARRLPGVLPSRSRPAAGSTYIPVPPGRRLSGALPAGGAGPRPAEQRHRGKGRERRRQRHRLRSARPEPGAERGRGRGRGRLRFPPAQERQRGSCAARAFCEGAVSAPASLRAAGHSPHRLPSAQRCPGSRSPLHGSCPWRCQSSSIPPRLNFSTPSLRCYPTSLQIPLRRDLSVSCWGSLGIFPVRKCIWDAVIGGLEQNVTQAMKLRWYEIKEWPSFKCNKQMSLAVPARKGVPG